MPKQPTDLAKLLAEFVGTFFLTLTISLTVQNVSMNNAAPLIHPGLAIGLVLSALIFAFGHISQAHYNPSVTLCHFLFIQR